MTKEIYNCLDLHNFLGKCHFLYIFTLIFLFYADVPQDFPNYLLDKRCDSCRCGSKHQRDSFDNPKQLAQQ